MNAITINEQTVQTAVQEMQAKGYNLLPLYEREGKLLPRKKIREHWENPTLPDDDQETNLGVLTRNVIVLDLDRKNGKDGVRTLQDAGLTYPDSFTVHTPSNGLHVYYRIPDGLSYADLKKDLGTHAGVDILCGKNAYAVAPGSSKNGKQYLPQSELPAVSELAVAPEWIMQLILRTTASTSEGNSAKAQQDLKAFDYSMNTPDEVKEREIRSVLARVDVTKITENDWFRAGAAIKTELGDYGFKLWDEWSSTDERYKEDEMLTRYDGFQSDGVLNFFELERLRKVPEYRLPGKYRTEDLHTPWRAQQDLHGQVLSPEHDQSFRDMHELVAEMLNGLNRWVSYSAAPGTGKTTAVFSILKTIAQRPPEDRVPLCIVFERVQACIDFMNEAINQGVPAELINVNHSYRFDPDYDPERPRKGVCGTESLDMQKARKIPFMIFSHEKIRRNPHSEYGVFQGKHGAQNIEQNRMMIWDEALLTTKAVELSGELLLEHCARFLARHGAKTDALCAWVKDVQDWALDAHQTAQGGELVRPAMSLPITAPNEVDKLIPRYNSQYPVLRALYDYLLEGRDELRYVQGKSWSLADYSVIIDEDLDRLVVLDASAAIEHLSKLNPRMRSIQGYNPDCSDIKVQCWNYASSKGTTKRSTGEFSAQVNWMFKRLSENLDKKCLVINTLEYAGMYGDSFERAYRESAFRMEDFAKNQKVSFLHWGNHTALNDYRDYEVVIIPQMLYLPETHLLTQAVGESGTWDAFNDMHESMNKLKDSNVRARIMQGMFRARGRNIQNGKRQGMLVCIRCDRALRLMQSLVKEGHLPGCSPEYMGGKEANAQKVEREFSEAFSTLMQEGRHKISSSKLKTMVKESTPDLKTETGILVTELGNEGRFWESLGSEGIQSIHTEHNGEDYIWDQVGRSWALRM